MIAHRNCSSRLGTATVRRLRRVLCTLRALCLSVGVMPCGATVSVRIRRFASCSCRTPSLPAAQNWVPAKQSSRRSCAFIARAYRRPISKRPTRLAAHGWATVATQSRRRRRCVRGRGGAAGWRSRSGSSHRGEADADRTRKSAEERHQDDRGSRRYITGIPFERCSDRGADSPYALGCEGGHSNWGDTARTGCGG